MNTKEERAKNGSYPSRDVDVAQAMTLLGWNWYRFARSTEKSSAAVIRGVLEVLANEDSHPIASAFLRAACDPSRDDTVLSKHWADAVNALKLFDSQYALGSRLKREKLEAIAKNARLLAASQAAAVRGALVETPRLRVQREILAVLALDGGPESLDALMPHVERAFSDPARLEALMTLEKLAKKTTELTSLFQRAHEAMAARSDSSQVVALGRQLGINGAGGFFVELDITPSQPNTRVYCEVRLDSKKGRSAFFVHLEANEKFTEFNEKAIIEDQLKLGRCEVAGLPTWLAEAAQRVGTEWDFGKTKARYLSGARLVKLVRWLQEVNGEPHGGRELIVNRTLQPARPSLRARR